MASPEVARFGELLRRVLGTRGGYSQANVLEDYFPSIDLFAMKAELLRLRGEQSFVVGGAGLGGVGLGGRVWCMNKTASHLAVIEQIMICNAAGVTGEAFLDLTTTGLPADGAGGQSTAEGQDTRYSPFTPGGTPPAGVSVANDQAGVVAGVPLATLFAATPALVIPTKIVLRPGYACVISYGAQGGGNNFVANFWGYVRSAEDAELK